MSKLVWLFPGAQKCLADVPPPPPPPLTKGHNSNVVNRLFMEIK